MKWIVNEIDPMLGTMILYISSHQRRVLTFYTTTAASSQSVPTLAIYSLKRVSE